MHHLYFRLPLKKAFASSLRLLIVLCLSCWAGVGWGQTVVWSNSSNATAWYTNTNWTPNTASNAWTTSNVAQFQNNGTASTAGINMGTASLSIGAIEITSARTTNILTIGNSSGTIGTLTLNGVTINSFLNTILRNSSGKDLTVANNETGTGKTMNVVLANATANVVNVDGSGNIIISSNISGSSKNLTYYSSSTGDLRLSGTNSFTGGMVAGLSSLTGSGKLRFDATAAFPTTGNVTVNAYGRISFNVAGTYGASGQTMTFNPTQTATGSLENNTSNIATVFPGSIILSADTRFEPAGATGSITLSGNASGSGLLLKQAAGNLILSGTGNALTGGTTIGNGTLTVNSGSSMGTGVLTMFQTSTNNTSINLNNASQTIGGLSSSFTATTGTQTQVLTLNGTALTVNQSANTTFGDGAVSTLTSYIAGTGSVIKAGTGSLTLTSNNIYTGGTTITQGLIVLGKGNILADAGNMILNGGTFSTGASAGFNETVGTLSLTNNSTIALGTSVHSLNFANSSAATWSASTLTITGWTGIAGASGTAGKIFFGNDATGLTAAQLAKISFSGYSPGAQILSTGEVVPVGPEINVQVATVNYLTGSNYPYATTTVGTDNDVVFTIQNTGGAPLSISNLVVTGSTYSLVGTYSFPIAVAAGSSTTFTLRFSPVAAATYSGQVTITSNDADEGTYSINLSGTGALGTISTSAISGSPFCVTSSGASVSVPFTSTGTYNTGNVFTAQLSDAGGSFSSPVSIGTFPSPPNSGTISSTIPSSSVSGSGYRIRVVSSDPVFIGSDNGTNLVINVAVTPAVSIVALPPGAICAGTSVTFTATPTNGGSPSYQWKVNGGNVTGSGATYTSTALNNGDIVSVVMTTSISCVTSTTATSNTIGMTVNPLPADPAGSISGTTPACTSTTLTYSAPSAGVYWQSTSGGTDITYPTTSSFPVSVSGSYYVRSYNGSCWSTGQAGPLAVVVNAPPTISTNGDPANASVFAPTAASFTVTATNATGYQWQLSIDNGVTFNNISGATSATYNTGTTSASMSNYQYQVILAGTAPCTNITSAVAILTVNTAASIWTNPITDVDPGLTAGNYTNNQMVAANIMVSGISKSAGIIGNSGTNRYNAANWSTGAFDAAKYFEFTLTPNSGYVINFASFVYTGQVSKATPVPGFALRSSLDGYNSNIGTPDINGATISLASAPFQGRTTATTFRFYVYGIAATSTTYSINDFTFNGNITTNCTATKLIFPPPAIANVPQETVIPSFPVAIACSDGTTIITTCNTGTITLTSSGCGLKGTLTRPVVNGVATFNDVYFDRSLQSNITLTATYSGGCGAYTPATSNTFNVTLPGGSPTVTVLKNENFDGSSPTWGYAIGIPTITNASAEGGTDLTGIKILGSNVIAKSYSKDNGSGKQGSTNTVTFNNVTGLGTYSLAKFSFQIASIPVGSVGDGSGADNNEFMVVECSLDNGSTWNTILTNNGSNNHSFNLSSASPVSLAYNANAIYSSGNSLWNQSAFQVTLPGGTTQFMFRFTANNNRTNENWVIDNLLLEGTTYSPTAQRPLPSIATNNISACPATNSTLSAGLTNAIGTVTYLWSPNTNISSTTDDNPIVNPPVTTTYSVITMDADLCKNTGSVVVTVPTGTSGSWTGLSNKDWFQCLNWGDGKVPTSTTNVAIGSTSNAPELDLTSPYASGFGNIANANNFTIANNTLSFISTNSKLITMANMDIQGGGTADMTNGGTIDVAGNWNSAAGTFTSGTGTLNLTGAAQTFTVAGTPVLFNLGISGSNTKTISNSITVSNALVLTAGILDIGTGNTLTANGTVTGSGYLRGSNTSNLIINGSGTFGTLYFDPTNDATTNVLKSLTINRTSTGTVTLGNKLYITDVLTATDGNLNTTDTLVLRSTSIPSTARVAPVGLSASISGKVTVERFIPGRRSFRFLAPGATTTSTIKQNWMENGLSTGYYSGNVDPKPGFGTHITGVGRNANGFDYSVTGNPSLYLWNKNTQKFDSVLNSSVTLNAFTPYRLLVRGSRSTDLSINAPAASNTILRATGSLVTQPVIFDVSGAHPLLSGNLNDFSFVPNPYASPVSWNLLTRNSLATTYSVWDPNLNSRGGFASYNGTDNLTAPPSSQVNNNIQPGQSFFVQTNSTSPSPLLQFLESSKTSNPYTYVFRQTSDMPKLAIALLLDSIENNANTADGLIAIFDSSFTTGIGDDDSYKLVNPDENMAIVSNGNVLIIEGRPVIKERDTIVLKLWQYRRKNYYFKFDPANWQRPDLTAYLKDSYLKDEKPLDLSKPTLIPFSINPDTASYASNRFMIVFRPSVTLPLSITSVKAWQKDKGIQVDWATQSEAGVDRYEVEKSVDGLHFQKVTTTAAKGNNAATQLYGWFDQNVQPGSIYYKIKVINTSGVYLYSQVVRVEIGSGSPGIAIYPNPATGNVVGVQFSNMVRGRYSVVLYNNLGQKLYTGRIEHNGGSAAYTLPVGAVVSKGTYKLQISDGNNVMNKTLICQ